MAHVTWWRDSQPRPATGDGVPATPGEFAAEIPEELNHAQLLADKIAALGGTPAATAAPVAVVSDAKAMLEVALAAEIATIGRYVKRRVQAEESREFGLAVDLDTIIAAETKHRDELGMMLARWP
jgi:bacterioferritin